MSKQKFIITKNGQTATLLLSAGFKLVNKDKEQWMFINDEIPVDLFDEVKDVAYTNVLNFKI